MSPKIFPSRVRRAALTLARGLKAEDRVAVFTFGDRARLAQTFTDNRSDVERALSTVHAASTTARTTMR